MNPVTSVPRRRWGIIDLAAAGGGVVLGVGFALAMPVISDLANPQTTPYTCADYWGGDLVEEFAPPASWGVSSPPQAGCVYVSVDQSGETTAISAYYPGADQRWLAAITDWAAANGMQLSGVESEQSGSATRDAGGESLCLIYALDSAAPSNTLGMVPGDPLGVVVLSNALF